MNLMCDRIDGPAGFPAQAGRPAVFEFFKAHPDLFDPDLAQLIDLDYLVKDSYLRARLTAAETRAVKRASKEPEAAKPRRRKSQSQNPG